MKIINLFLVLLLLNFVFIGNLSATTYAKTTLQRFIETSTIIVKAKVDKSHAAWDEDHKAIYSYTTIEINEILKGESKSSKITIVQLGGSVGDESLIIDTSPKFSEGEECLLFLIYHQNRWWIHSTGMGKFDLLEEAGKIVTINPRISKDVIESNIKYDEVNSTYPKFVLSELKLEIEKNR